LISTRAHCSKARATQDKLSEQLLHLILQTASGEVKAKNELHGYKEIAIWKEGVTL